MFASVEHAGAQHKRRAQGPSVECAAQPLGGDADPGGEAAAVDLPGVGPVCQRPIGQHHRHVRTRQHKHLRPAAGAGAAPLIVQPMQQRRSGDVDELSSCMLASCDGGHLPAAYWYLASTL